MAFGTGPAEIAFGPMLIGTVFNVLLYGIMITQVYLYYQSYPNDRKWMKFLVFVLFFADTVNCIFDLVFMYSALIKNFNNPDYLTKATWVFGTDPAMTGIIGAMVQLFFAWRVKVVTGKLWISILIASMAAISSLAGIGTAIAVGMIPEFVQFYRFKEIVIIWLLGSAIADLSITFTLTYHLQKHKTGFSATDDVVNRIIRLTVQTGAITSVCAILDMVFYLVDTSGIHLMFNIPLSKLYTNSLMSSLNARGNWKFQKSTAEVTSSGVAGGGTGTKSRTDVVHLQTNTRPEVFVHVESHEMSDVEDKRSPNNLFPDDKSDGEYHQQVWEVDVRKHQAVGNVV